MKKYIAGFLLLFSPALAMPTDELDWSNDWQEWQQIAEDYSQDMLRYAKVLLQIRNRSVAEDFSQQIAEVEVAMRENNHKKVEYIDQFLREKAGRFHLSDDLLMRLALVYYQKANFDLQAAMQTYHEQLSLYDNKKIAQSPSLPVANYQQTQLYCQSLLKEYPHSSSADYARYLLAVIEEENGNYESARKMYAATIRDYPFSKYLAELHWRYGELSFDFRDFPAAVASYQFLVNQKNPDYASRAQYKLGAIYYQEGRYREALQQFTQLLAIIEQGLEQNHSLRNEVYEYLGLLYLQGQSLASLSQDSQFSAIMAVAERMEAHNQYLYAREIYQDFVQKQPLNPRIPLYYSKIVESLQAEGKEQEAISWRQRLLSHLQVGGSWWKKNSLANDRLLAEEYLETSKLAIARHYAHRAIESGKSADYQVAKKYYENFVETEKYGAEIAVAQFELGQILIELKQDRAASMAMQLAIALGLQENRSQAIGEMLLAKRRYLGLSQQKVSTKSLQSAEQALTKAQQEWLQDYQRYSPELRNSEYQLPLSLASAHIYLGRSQIAQAVPILQSILAENYIDSAQISYVEEAAQWLTEIYSSQKKWQEAEALAERLKNIGTKQAQNLDLFRKTSFQNAQLLEAELLEEKEQYAEAASLFLAFANKKKDQVEGEQARLRAALLYQQAGQYEKSSQLAKNLFSGKLGAAAKQLHLQNLLSAFQWAALDKFLKSERASSKELQESFAQTRRLLNFLQPEPSFGERFLKGFERSSDYLFGLQAFKEFYYSGDAIRAKQSLRVLESNPQSKNKLDLQALAALYDYQFAEKDQAVQKCQSYLSAFAQLQTRTDIQQDLSWQCDWVVREDYREWQTKNLAAARAAGSSEVLLFVAIMADRPVAEIQEEIRLLRQQSSDNGLAVLALSDRYLAKRGQKRLNPYQLFPYPIFLAEQIPWRPLVRSDKEFSLQQHCEKSGYGSCYRRLQAFQKKYQSSDYDLLLKLALILDRSSEAETWMAKWKASSPEAAASFNWWQEIDAAQRVTVYSQRILQGQATAFEYFSLAKELYQQGQYRRANFVIDSARKRYAQDNLVQLASRVLIGRGEALLGQSILDPRLVFLAKAADFATSWNQSQVRRSLAHSSWGANLSLWQSLSKDKKLRSYRSTDSHYHQLLSFHYFRKKGESERWQQFQAAAQRSEFFPSEFESGNLRGVASETK